jgi:hypothetical protein
MFCVSGVEVISKVSPSGAERATYCVPILPLAPALLSTTTGWPSRL